MKDSRGWVVGGFTKVVVKYGGGTNVDKGWGRGSGKNLPTLVDVNCERPLPTGKKGGKNNQNNPSVRVHFPFPITS